MEPLSYNQLMEAFEYVARAVAKEDNRPILTYMALIPDKAGNIYLAGADGHRLHLADISCSIAGKLPANGGDFGLDSLSLDAKVTLDTIKPLGKGMTKYRKNTPLFYLRIGDALEVCNTYWEVLVTIPYVTDLGSYYPNLWRVIPEVEDYSVIEVRVKTTKSGPYLFVKQVMKQFNYFKLDITNKRFIVRGDNRNGITAAINWKKATSDVDSFIHITHRRDKPMEVYVNPQYFYDTFIEGWVEVYVKYDSPILVKTSGLSNYTAVVMPMFVGQI